MESFNSGIWPRNEEAEVMTVRSPVYKGTCLQLRQIDHRSSLFDTCKRIPTLRKPEFVEKRPCSHVEWRRSLSSFIYLLHLGLKKFVATVGPIRLYSISVAGRTTSLS